jgi:hypothetical protein
MGAKWHEEPFQVQVRAAPRRCTQLGPEWGRRGQLRLGRLVTARLTPRHCLRRPIARAKPSLSAWGMDVRSPVQRCRPHRDHLIGLRDLLSHVTPSLRYLSPNQSNNPPAGPTSITVAIRASTLTAARQLATGPVRDLRGRGQHRPAPRPGAGSCRSGTLPRRPVSSVSGEAPVGVVPDHRMDRVEEARWPMRLSSSRG